MRPERQEMRERTLWKPQASGTATVAEVNFSGGTTNTAAYTVIVSAMLEIKDGSTIGANFAGLAHGNPIKKVILSE